jgi:uncharacterized membrane protein
MNLQRLMRHLFTPHWIVRRAFPPQVLTAIEQAIAASEQSHDGELRFAVEAALHPAPLWRGQTTRARAEELFAALRVWDTAHNSGVLIYVQLVDRRIEIVADRGINARVAQSQWDAICRRMEAAFRARRFDDGALAAIREITTLLAEHFPPLDDNPNELPDKPVVL